MAGILVEYPQSLPCPVSAPLTPAQRILVSDLPGPTKTRSLQRDFLATQQLEWVLDADQSQLFEIWWGETLKRGGLWFAADWPLPSGHTGNVYRFLGTPAWTLIPRPAAAGSSWRVRAIVEVRGRGMPPRDYDVFVVTSRPYPVEAQDALGIGFGFVSGGDIYWPSDYMDIGFGFVEASLRNPLVPYEDWPAESVDVAFNFDSGMLVTPLIQYENWPAEGADIGFGFESGSMPNVLIRYQNWPAEGTDISFGFDSGTLA